MTDTTDIPLVELSRDEMEKNVARFHALEPLKMAFVDTVLPGYEREILSVIGAAVIENAANRPAIPAMGAFNLAYVRSKPGARGALHSHPTVEVFIPMSGRWAVIWGSDADFGRTPNEIELGPGDVISVPPGVMRCFKNVCDQEAVLMAIVGTLPGRSDAGRVVWPDEVIRQAAGYGVKRNEQGDLVVPQPAD
jgi:mannose-6-phosphate isomerase-like protein (cupin superfamily)